MRKHLVQLVAAAAMLLVVPATASAACPELNPSAGNTENLTPCTDGIIVGDGSGLWEVTIQYHGSSAGFWHSVWYFDASDLSPSAGTFLFCKTAGCVTNPYPTVGEQSSVTFTWDASSELVLGLYVLPEGVSGGSELPAGGYWIFTGAGSRNPDNKGHYAYFETKVYADDDVSTLANRPAGSNAFIGFEDKCKKDHKTTVQDGTKKVKSYEYQWVQTRFGKKKKKVEVWTEVPKYKDVLTCSGGSDWDFNDAVLSISWDKPSIPTETVPEPATMTLLATGLAGMAAARRRRRD
jgi:hypothetical protein